MGKASVGKAARILWTAGLMALGASRMPALEGSEILPQSAVVVRTYSHPAASLDTIRSAQWGAGRLLRDAGVDLTWLDCGRGSEPGADQAACETLPAANEVVLHVTTSQSRETGSGEVALGSSLIAADERRPTLSKVYLDRVLTFAAAARADAAVILGRVIAHELGHLLLRTNRHPSSGLMRATWLKAELRSNEPGLWAFLPQEALGLRAAIADRLADDVRLALK
jgi:hypothetical protein